MSAGSQPTRVQESQQGSGETYAGLIEKIPYLQDLGITAVELLPVFHFDEQDAPPRFKNYWGYAPVSFFAPTPAYSSRKDPLETVDEFRDMVKSLHRAGIEVILDVVYNHTAKAIMMARRYVSAALQMIHIICWKETRPIMRITPAVAIRSMRATPSYAG